VIDLTNIVVADSGTPTEPVTLGEAKAWLRVDYSDDDSLITGMIKSARQSIEHFTNRALVVKTVSLNAETPEASYDTNPLFVETSYKLKLPYAKGSVVSLLVLKDWEDATLVNEDDYEVKGNTIYYLNGWYGITYTVTPTVPQALKEAVLMEVAERYNNRGETNSEGLSKAAEDKAAPFVDIWL
jgi:hypothetical protein